mmetsp:Transcript_4901/g.17201  ORF Transcript_4901/g.17201 Transcript_4901/m.17201 type:complete len:96 (-) Transcript_4901:1755-2042(-)
MKMHVRPLATLLRVFMISASVEESRLLVASSQTRSLGLLRIARAMAILCLSPPDNLIPRSPTTVSCPRGNELTRSSSWADLIASRTSSLDAFWSP